MLEASLLPSFLLYLFYCFAIAFVLTYFDAANRVLSGLQVYVLTDPQASPKPRPGEANGDAHDPPGGGRPPREGGSLESRANQGSQRKATSSTGMEDGSSTVDQIGRAQITSAYLFGRLFFKEYNEFMTFVLIGMGSFTIYFLYWVLPESRYEWLDRGSSVTILMGLISVWRLCKTMLGVQWHVATTSRVDRVVSFGVGLLVPSCLSILLFRYPQALDFDWEKATWNAGELLANHLNTELGKGNKVYDHVPISPTLVKCVLIFLAGVLAFLLLPCALRVAKCYHTSTFPISWDIGVLQSPWFVRWFLHAGLVLSILSTLLWINPLSELFIVQCTASSPSDPLLSLCDVSAQRFDWARSRGMSKHKFEFLRMCLLLSSAIFQLLLLRVHVQGYLNSGLGVWFETMHGIPPEVVHSDHSHHQHQLLPHHLQRINLFVCKVALQCVMPGALVILFLGLAFSKSEHLDHKAMEQSHLIPPLLFRQFFTFLAWMTTCIWVGEFLPILALFRLGQFKAY